MTRDVLKDANGDRIVVNARQSAVVEASFTDADGVAIVKASLQTLTATLTNAEDNIILNSRDEQSVLDANNGTVATNGTLTLKLQPDDNVVAGSTLNEIEEHILVLRWTWTDGDGDPMSGAKQYIIEVLASP